MSEADFQTKFTRWAKYNLKTNTACELKVAKEGQSLPFSAVKDHQILALSIVKNNGLGYKIPDAGYDQKPFDYFFIHGEAYVVVMYCKRNQKEFFMIDVDDFVNEGTQSKRRSLTEERAREIGVACYLA